MACSESAAVVLRPTQGNLREESGLLFTLVLTLWSSRHIDGHVGRGIIAPSDLTQSDLRALLLPRDSLSDN